MRAFWAERRLEMTDLLIKLFVKNRENVSDKSVRRAFGTMTSVVGIIINILLFAGKFTVGTLFGSVAVSADAINNLSDAGSSLISLVSFKISSKPADRKHPFGHARIEYIASILVAFIILFIGIDLLKESAGKIFAPAEIGKSYIVVAVLAVSILAKLWLGVFYRKIAKKTDSSVLFAAAADSFSDVMSTGAALASSLVWIFFDLNIDAYVGLAVSVLILVAGLKILNENKNIILGEAPDQKTVETIRDTAFSYPQVLGIHDLLVHSYGAGAVIASFHAEVDGKADFFESHDVIDNIEKELFLQHNISCTIHMDPIVTDDERINELKSRVCDAARTVSEDLRIHDFRCVEGPTHTNLIFDLEVPFEEKRKDSELADELERKIKEIDDKYYAVINVDRV